MFLADTFSMNWTRWIPSICTAALALPAPTLAHASLPPRTEQAVVRYLTELKRIETSSNRISIERLFTAVDTLQEYLCYGLPIAEWTSASAPRPSTIEDLPDDEYEALNLRLRGLLLNRAEVVLAAPDSEVFLPLARTKGLEADRAFMEMYFKTVPIAGWPAYVEQQTDYSGCDSYGTGVLVSLYEGWRQFQTHYPERYRTQAEERLEHIRDSLARVNCACGGPDTVVRELELFLGRFPRDDMAAKVREELNEIKEGRSKIRFNCLSG